MPDDPPVTARPRPLLSGAVAGAVATVLFTWLHDLIISDIWNTLPMMLVAGVGSGVCIAWSYRRLFRPPTVASWITYNASYVALLILLGVASLVVFDPVYSITALTAGQEPPRELMAQAMPLSLAFIVVSSALVWALWGRTLLDAVAVFVTSAVLILLLGLNVAVLGLVHLTGTTTYLVTEFFALVAFLAATYLVSYLVIEAAYRKRA